MAGRDIEFILKARDDASAKIAAMQAQIEKLSGHAARGGQQMDKALSLANAAVGLRVAGDLMRALNVALETTGTNVEKLQAGLEALPGAVGEAAQLGRWIGEKIWGKSAAYFEREAEALAKKTNQQLEQYRKQEQQEREQAESKRRADYAYALGIERELADMKQQAADEEAKRWDARREAQDAILEESNKAYQDEIDRARTLAGLDSEIREMKLRGIGDIDKAERESINRKYQAQIDAARDANDTEREERLQTLRDLELGRVGKDKNKSNVRSDNSVGAYESRTATLGTGSDPLLTVAQQQFAVMRQQLEMMGRQGQLLSSILEKQPELSL